MDSLEPQQQQALVLLASGKGVDEISETLNIHRTTLWMWRKQPEFIASWNQIVQQGKEKQIQTLLELQQQALSVLKDCLSSQNELLRFKAAITIVEKVGAITEGPVYTDEIQYKQQQYEKFRELTDLR